VKPARKWYARPAKGPTARTATVRKLIEAAVQQTGLVPTDARLAGMLASSVARIQHHRRLLGL
jgi:hypothetical protein